MDSVDQVRAARATLAWLEGPFLPPRPQQLIDERGPVRALEQLAADAEADASQPAMNAHQIYSYAAVALARADQVGARIVIPEDDHWPPQLTNPHPAGSEASAVAQCLWVRGSGTLPAAAERVVAVVGSRAASSYGQHVAQQLGYQLAAAGVTVVATSGFGVDASALRGALAASGPAVAVLPSGVDITYPAGNRLLLERVAETGLLVTAWPPGMEPTRRGFAATTRLVAHLASVVVVVEASLRSAALGVVTHALDLGRPAMVVPGPVSSAVSAGCHELLRTHRQVRLVRDAADVLAELSPHG